MEKFLELALTTRPNDSNVDVESGSSDTTTMQSINAHHTNYCTRFLKKRKLVKSYHKKLHLVPVPVMLHPIMTTKTHGRS